MSARITSPEQCVQALRSESDAARLTAVKTLKNSVIGHRIRKTEFIQGGAIPLLVELLRDHPPIAQNAAAALGSFAHGTKDHAETVSQPFVIEGLTIGLAAHDVDLMTACLRSLKIIYSCGSPAPNALFVPDVGQTSKHLVQLLGDNDQIAQSAAILIAHGCQTEEHREAIATAGGVNALLQLLSRANFHVTEAAVEALAQLLLDNEAVGQCLQTATIEVPGFNGPVVYFLLRLLKAPQSRVRVLAAECVTNYILSQEDSLTQDFTAVANNQLLPALLKILKGSNIPDRTQAAETLAKYIRTSERLQRQACESDLFRHLKSTFTKLQMGANAKMTDEEMPKLGRAYLRVTAALCSRREANRQCVIGHDLLTHIMDGLVDKDDTIRVAATNCVHSLSRSVKNIRTTLMDAKVADPLCEMLADSEVTVKRAASAALCNLVMEFSPMRKIVVEKGGVSQLATLTQSMDRELRINGVWALKNLLFNHDPSDGMKDVVMQDLGWEHLQELIKDHDEDVSVQALGLLRNLLCGRASSTEEVLATFKQQNCDLLSLLHSILKKTSSPEAQTQIFYCLCNIANGNQSHKEAIMEHSGLLDAIVEGLSSSTPSVVVGALWCIINLTYKERDDAEGTIQRVQRLRARNVEHLLQTQLVSHPSLDVKDRVTTALQQFQA